MPFESVYLNGGFIGVTTPYKTETTTSLNAMSFVNSSTGTNTSSVTIPTNAQAGDVAIIVDNVNTAGTISAPSGWTLIRSDSVASNITGTTYFRILQGGDAGTTVTSTDGSSTDHFMLCAVFRPNISTITGITINDSAGEATSGDPATQTLSMSAETARPIIGFFVMGQRGSNNADLSITDVPDGFTGIICEDEAGRDVIELYYIVYNEGNTTANVTGDIGDQGAQFMQSFYFTFSATTQTQSSNDGIFNLPAVFENLSPPSIVTDGLVLALDAGDPASYPGSGGTWYDTSGVNGNFSLVNSPTFSSGYFTLDGSTQGFTINSVDSTTVNSFTYSLWAMPTATHEIDTESTSSTTGLSGQRYLVFPQFTAGAGAGISCGTNGVSVYEHASGYLPPLLVSTTAISGSVPTLITVVYNNRTPSLYLNGVFDKTGLTSPKTPVSMRGDQIGYGAYGYFQGRMYTCHMYNKALSASEVLQNYNALKGRFGL